MVVIIIHNPENCVCADRTIFSGAGLSLPQEKTWRLGKCAPGQSRRGEKTVDLKIRICYKRKLIERE